MSFFKKNGAQEGEADPVWGLVLVGRGEEIRKG
jgi:hypothetical protein